MSSIKIKTVLATLLVPLLLGACSSTGGTSGGASTSGGAATSAAAPATAPASSSAPAGVTIDPTGATIIDVRTPSEYASGHLQGAINIDIQGVDFAGKIAAYPKDGKYILYCRSGVRAGNAMQVMKGMGFTDVTNAGGYAAASKATGLPIVT